MGIGHRRGRRPTVPGFLFEPEVPISSLKGALTWNELEQLLDNPKRNGSAVLCSRLVQEYTPRPALARGGDAVVLLTSGRRQRCTGELGGGILASTPMSIPCSR